MFEIAAFTCAALISSPYEPQSEQFIPVPVAALVLQPAPAQSGGQLTRVYQLSALRRSPIKPVVLERSRDGLRAPYSIQRGPV